MKRTVTAVTGEGVAPRITRKHLVSLPKGKLIDIIRSTEAHLLAMYSANEGMSWRGLPEDTQRAYTRAHAFKDAVVRLQEISR